MQERARDHHLPMQTNGGPAHMAERLPRLAPVVGGDFLLDRVQLGGDIFGMLSHGVDQLLDDRFQKRGR
jgi:hypothetical protein